jgi:uncharacterized membrane protein YgdD (TMEM256/DUF423 family)
MQKLFFLSASLLGALGVAIGAFGAHKLKPFLIETGRYDTFDTAVKYQFYHVFALLITALLLYRIENKLLEYAGLIFLAGIIIFSGSLYILCLTNVGKWGAITPIGGTLFIAGWVLMLVAILKNL